MNEFLATSLAYLKGVGPQRSELLQKELNLFNFEDLLYHFPFRYIDRSVFTSISEAKHVEYAVQLKGKITRIEELGAQRKKRLIAHFHDSSGFIQLTWFQGLKWIKPQLNIHSEFIVYGKVKYHQGVYQITHPDIQLVETEHKVVGWRPVYSSTEKLNAKGLHSKGIEKLTYTLVSLLNKNIPENLPHETIVSNRLIEREEAFKQIHHPASPDQARKAIFRLKFEELYFLQLELLIRKQLHTEKEKGFVFGEVGACFLDFYENHLPFELTNAQKRVLKEIRQDCKLGQYMNRLIQGDVGSGKTIVAFLSMLIAIGNGFQAALMAPTEILAQQHFESIQEFAKKININVALLTGSSKKKERELLHEGLLNGEINMLIGTHALIEDTVKFKNLGIIIIDEQHRFGVAQRSKLWRKNTIPPHVLVMTATPIPRTLAMTLYGDLDVSIIDELPPGRKPITTLHRNERARLNVFDFIKKEIALGRQIYIVYPLISESENLDYHNLEQGFESIQRTFPLPEYRVSIVHGKLKPDVKAFEMERFVKGETQIMVATTVIEVGVNVPNASVMLIESAERFGLSQLHQLRGRVGRGAEKSYCILMTGDKLTKESKKRMETMVKTQDGFEIAEVDLELRGPGDLLGTQQSGLLNLKIADLAKDGQILTLAREEARKLIKEDPNLTNPAHLRVRNYLQTLLKAKPNWGKIS